MASTPHPAAPARRRLDIILNSGSGTGTAAERAAHIEAHLRERGLEPRVILARGGREIHDAAVTAARGDASIVVAGGGDGTISGVASQLAGTTKTMGVLPFGTFNFFARRLGIPTELDGALDVLATGQATPVDVGEVNGRIFLNNASIGLYPAVLKQRETTYRQLGRSRAAAYASVALVLVQPPALLNLRIEADGRPLPRRTPLLFIGTNEFQMETFAIPGGDCVRQGRLACYITRPLGKVALWRLALRAFFRGLHGAEELEVVCAEEIRVTLRRRQVRVALDGEIAMFDTPLRLRMLCGGLSVLTGGSTGTAEVPSSR